MLRSRPGVRLTYARRTRQYHAIHTGALRTTAQTAIATGPSSPATSDAATVTVPGYEAPRQVIRNTW